MKKGISILLVLFCLLVNTVCIRPLNAEEEGVTEDETIVEVETEETENSEEEPPVLEEENIEIEEVDKSEEVIEESSEPIEVPESGEEAEGINLPKQETDEEEGFVPVVKEEAEISNEGFSFTVPEEFRMRPSDREGKKALKEETVLEKFEQMEEGEDYIEDELMFLSDDPDYVKQVAEIYHCEIRSYEDGIALLKIKDEELSVNDIFSASLNEELELPLVEPNYVIHSRSDAMMGKYDGQVKEDGTLPQVNDWNGWINETFEDPDPFLMSPSDDLQWHHELIDTYTGWNATMGNPGIKVALIGEGVNPDHEELLGKVEIEEIDEVSHCYGNGMGTAIAGIIAASADNGAGGAGIAPNVGILSINIFEIVDGNDSYTSSYYYLIKAIDKAVEKKAHIIDIYWYDWTYNWNLDMAIQEAYHKGALIVAQAGDDGSNIKCFPGAYDHVICVADITRDGTKHYQSNYGAWVNVAAPGPVLASAFSTDEEMDNSGYAYVGGTPISAAVVTGSLALYMSKMGRLNYDQALALLKKTSTKVSSKQVGFGMVNVGNMFAKTTTSPVIRVRNSAGNNLDLSKPISDGSYFMIENPGGGERDVILYTLDGKKPSIKDGKIVNGTVYEPGSKVSLDGFEKGKTITLNAAVVNGLGVLGKVTKVSIKTPVIIINPVKIKTVTLDTTKVTLKHSKNEPDALQLTSNLINVNGENVDLDNVDHIWVSSNSKVAVVDEDGYVETVGSGSAKITLKILDGSKKSATCTLSVMQLPEEMTIKGQTAMAPGSSATFSVSILPSNTKNKKVTWSLDSDNSMIKIDAKGKVTVPGSASIGDWFVVKAVSQETDAVYAEKYVEICPKATSIRITTNGGRTSYTKAGVLNTVNLFTIDIQDDLHPDSENQVQLKALITGNNISPVWTSSNAKIATVDENGLVTAHKAGTAKITCTANDGSKKKATVTIKVTIPVSNIVGAFGNSWALSAGKTLNLSSKIAYGKAYGNPSLKKVNWTIEKITYNNYGEERDITDVILAKKYVSIDKSGKLKTSKKLDSEGYLNGFSIYLRADAADGTNYFTEAYVWVSGPFTGFCMEDSYGTGEILYSDTDPDHHNYVYTEWDIPVEITSSNPNIVGAYIDPDSKVEIFDDPYYGYAFFIEKNGKFREYHHGYRYDVIMQTYPGKKGTAYLTIKAADGSGLVDKIKVVVK